MKMISKAFLLILLTVLLLVALFIPAKVCAQNIVPPTRFDDRVLIDLAQNRTPEQTDFFMFITNTCHYGDVGIPAGLLAGGIIANNKEMRQNALYVASSTALSYGLTELIKLFVKRPRPFIHNINIVPVYRAQSTSFPSGHTSTTMATATALSLAYPKWYVIVPAYLWAGSVSYSRMYLGVHYPTDVASGALLGVGSAFSLHFLKR